MDDGAAVWERFIASGGNVFDTSHVWHGGAGEAALGEWLTSSGLHDQVQVIVKGAHTPHCDPESVLRHLHESLERLQRDRADIFLLHRDNLDVPVGEFVDALGDAVREERVSLVGASNWTIARFEEANTYAQQRGKPELALLSNHFALAVMEVPLAPGVVGATDAASFDYLRRTQTPLFAWSSQARGYFQSNPNSRELPEGTHPHRLFASPRNRRRRDRAFQLARELGVSAANVALAYVLQQPFPTFAIVGPRRVEEVDALQDGVRVSLTEAQLDWLIADDG